MEVKRQEENVLNVTAKSRLKTDYVIPITAKINVFSAKGVDIDLVKRQVYQEFPVITLVVKYAFPRKGRKT
jgi:hypothetical protein